jgi:hypothetical protein
MVPNYITPITKIHSSFAEAKTFFDENKGLSWWSQEADALAIEVLAEGKRNLIVGEPGVGKSLLLERLENHLDATGVATLRISLRIKNALDEINDFLKRGPAEPHTLLLDALDEVKAADIPETIQSIETIAKDNPAVSIFLSCRWVFISRYASLFPSYRFISISPFTDAQVRSYLIAVGRTGSEVDALLQRLTSFGHPMLVVQIPRYLNYLNQYLVDKGVDAASHISRNELFEYFIYSKLELETKKLDGNKRALVKRLLEKLALTMEIYQTNVITQDELMTFFDDVESDLKHVALSQVGLEVFYDYSLLKVGREDPDQVEFDNAEFQEYLAAKEITRLPEPTRAAFSFATDSQMNEIYPTWYNALTFLVDMQPPLLGLLVEFSGLRADKFRVLDDTFLNFLARVDPRKVPAELRHSLFRDVLSYHERTLQWLSSPLANAIASFSESTAESFLRKRVALVELRQGAERFVPLANISYAIGHLLRHRAVVDRSYWRSKLIEYASSQNENGVLQRHALHALEYLGDSSVIDDLPDLSDAEELVAREYLDLCASVAPDTPKSVQAFIGAVRRNELHGRYGLFAIRAPASLKLFLAAFCNDAEFRREFLDDTSIFRDKDTVIAKHVEAVLDPELRELAKTALVASTHLDVAHSAQSSSFIHGLWIALRKNDAGFVTEMTRRILTDSERINGIFYVARFLSEVIEIDDVRDFILTVKSSGGSFIAHQVMLAIKQGGRACASEIYEAGRSLLSGEYAAWEQQQSEDNSSNGKNARKSLHKLRALLEPEPGKWSLDVFRFYNDRGDELDAQLTEDDRSRLKELLSETVFKFTNPGAYDVTIKDAGEHSKTITTNSLVHVFGDALVTAKSLGLDLTPYRARIISLIPFVSGDRLKTIFEIVRELKPGELSSVIEVYRSRHSDLWRYNPDSFVNAVEQYHVTDAVPVLRGFIFEDALEKYVRREALRVLDSIAPDAAFLTEVVEKYGESTDTAEEELTAVANGLLITNHANRGAIQWRLQTVVERAAAFVLPTGRLAHAVGVFEGEILEKSFAKPLMELKHPGYENDFLAVLDDALRLWGKGADFHEYASYIWAIVYAYFDNLKEQRSYAPLQSLESLIAKMKDRSGGNWLAAKMVSLRRSYLSYLGRPASIAKAIAKYNDARKFNDKEIRNSEDLLRHLQDALDADLRGWIEGEGAYDVLSYKVANSGSQQYERLVQKTVKSQIEYVLIKRGFQVDVLREPQLLDDKRTDLLVRYGFAGPIVVEVKLTSNKDIRGRSISKSKSYTSMDRYMRGYGASYGIFLVIDNHGARNLADVATTFRALPGVSVISYDCSAPKRRKPSAPATRKRKTRKAAHTRRSRRLT